MAPFRRLFSSSSVCEIFHERGAKAWSDKFFAWNKNSTGINQDHGNRTAQIMSVQKEKIGTLADGEAKNLLPPGTVIDKKYKILSVLGSGGMGTVYLVNQLDLDRDFALKILDAGNTDGIAVRRFHLEAKTAASLRHPNLVAVHDFGVWNEIRPYLVMDCVTGVPLDQLLKERKTLPVDYVVALAVQVGFALLYAHEHGIVHRDIKPSNIIVLHPDKQPSEGTIKVVDFGIAKLMQSEGGQIQALTRTGEIFGSPMYMSPEQCRGTAIDQRTDIYSLGCVLYECLTGSPPFVGDTAMSTMVKRLTEKAPSLSDVSLQDFPPALETVVQKMLANEPEDRFADFTALIQNLMLINDADAQIATKTSLQRPQFAYWFECMLVLATALTCAIATHLFDRQVVVPALLANDDKPSLDKATIKPLPGELPVFETSLKHPWREVVNTKYGAQEVLHFPSVSGRIGIGLSPERAAKGDVIVPPNSLVALRLNEEATLDEHFLDNLTDVKFSQLSFGSPKVGVDNGSMRMFEKLKYLEHLNISGAPITVLESVCHAPHLSRLDVTDTHVPLSEIIRLDRFRDLTLFYFGPVKDPHPTLKELIRNPVLTDVRYTGPEVREEKTNARGLDASDIEFLVQIPKLANFAVRHSPAFDDACLERLLAGKSLSELELKECAVTARSIPLLKKQKLRHLIISTIGWSESDVEKLKHLPYSVEIKVPERSDEQVKLQKKLIDTEDLFLDKKR